MNGLLENIEIFYIREWIDEPLPEDLKDHLYFYDIRHGYEDMETPVVLERAVSVGYYGTVGVRQSLDLNFDECITLNKEEQEFLMNWHDLSSKKKCKNRYK